MRSNGYSYSLSLMRISLSEKFVQIKTDGADAVIGSTPSVFKH